jgi:hypothetical protein
MPKDLSIAEETIKFGPEIKNGDSSFRILTTGKL